MVANIESASPSAQRTSTFGFRPWVRSVCRRAGVWTAAMVLVLTAAVSWQGGVSGAPLARALGVLALYGALFMASLLKIWWTAGHGAAGWDDRGLWFQALHRFRPARIGWESILAGGVRPGTRAYRLVVARSGNARERFLNLAVIRNHHQFVSGLESELLRRGLVRGDAGLSRPGWDQESDAIPS